MAARLPNKSTNKFYLDINNDVFRMMKISNVRKPGRPAKTVGALLKQPSDLQKKRIVVFYIAMRVLTQNN